MVETQTLITRVLPPQEWERLDGTEAAPVWRLLDPTTTTVLVVERDGVLVASWLALTVTHLECLWVEPASRHRVSVGRRLLTAMRAFLAGRGDRLIVTSATDASVRDMIVKAGGSPVPGELYAMPWAVAHKENVSCPLP